MKDVFYMDKVSFSGSGYAMTLKINLPLNKLKNHCKSLHIVEPNKMIKEKCGYFFRMDVVMPTQEFFKILMPYKKLFGYYKPSTFEATINTPEQTNILRLKRVSERRKFSFWSQSDRQYGKYDWDKHKDKTGDETDYQRNSRRTIQLVQYDRFSKVTGEKCKQVEFRLQGSKNIIKRTGLKTFEDFSSANPEAIFKKLFEKNVAIVPNGEIDKLKLGKLLESKRTVKDEKTENDCYLSSEHFLNAYHISDSIDLWQAFLKLKREFRRGKGRRTIFAKNVLKLRSVEGFIKQ